MEELRHMYEECVDADDDDDSDNHNAHVYKSNIIIVMIICATSIEYWL